MNLQRKTARLRRCCRLPRPPVLYCRKMVCLIVGAGTFCFGVLFVKSGLVRGSFRRPWNNHRIFLASSVGNNMVDVRYMTVTNKSETPDTRHQTEKYISSNSSIHAVSHLSSTRRRATRTSKLGSKERTRSMLYTEPAGSKLLL